MTKNGEISAQNVPLAYLILTVVTLFAFWPSLSAGFLNWDDPSIFLRNPLVFSTDLHGLWRIFLQTDSHNKTYIPLTILSFAWEQKLFGVHPFTSHLINLLLHVVCSWLVCVLALRMGLSRVAAFLGALIFALHPLRVESVAWVTERKDVLFVLFYLAAMRAYWDYAGGLRKGRYVIALLCAAASVLAKPMALSLPLVLFLLDERAGRRWTTAAFWDKVPFMLALWPIAGITFVMNQHPLALPGTASLGILAWSATFYVEKFFWPMGLSAFYLAPGAAQFTESALLVALLGVVSWALRRDRWWRFALLFYIITMFFMWRLDYYDGPRGLVHDRFMYLPSLGFTLCLGAWLDQWRAGPSFVRWGKITWLGIGIVTALLAGYTFNRCFVWQNSWTYWGEVLDSAPKNYFALLNRAAYLVEGDAQEIYGWPKRLRLLLARDDLRRATLIAPKDPDVWQNLGIVLTKLGEDAKAEEALKMAVHLAPVRATIYNDWGNYYLHRGDWRNALRNYNTALQLKPSYPEALFNRALLFEWMRKNLPPAGSKPSPEGKL